MARRNRKKNGGGGGTKLSILLIGCNSLSFPIVRSFCKAKLVKPWKIGVYVEGDDPRLYEGTVKPNPQGRYELDCPELENDNGLRFKERKNTNTTGSSNNPSGFRKASHVVANIGGRSGRVSNTGKTVIRATLSSRETGHDPYAQRSKYLTRFMKEGTADVPSPKQPSVFQDMWDVCDFYKKTKCQIIFFAATAEFMYSEKGTNMLKQLHAAIKESKVKQNNYPIFCVLRDIPNVKRLFADAELNPRFIIRGHPLFTFFRFKDGFNTVHDGLAGDQHDTRVGRIIYFKTIRYPVYLEVLSKERRVEYVIEMYNQRNITLNVRPELALLNKTYMSFFTEGNPENLRKKMVYDSLSSIMTIGNAKIWLLPLLIFVNHKNAAADVHSHSTNMELRGRIMRPNYVNDVVFRCFMELLESHGASAGYMAKQPFVRFGDACSGFIMQWFSELFGRDNIFGARTTMEFHEQPMLLTQQRAELKRYIFEAGQKNHQMLNCKKLLDDTEYLSRMYYLSSLRPDDIGYVTM